MSKRQWTQGQLAAIGTRDKTLLVSAAAGSGKTATLTERIIQTLLDEDKPENISDMLIVTFTKAAAAELRERITAAVRSALAERPGDHHLERQMLLLPGAKILTIDAFCGDILRGNSDRVGVSPGYRIADEAEAELLAVGILDELIADAFEGRCPEVITPGQMDALADCLTNTRSQSDLATVIRDLYNKLNNTEGGVNTIRELAELYNCPTEAPIEENIYVKYVMDNARLMAEHYLGAWEELSSSLIGFGGAADKHRAMLDEDMQRFRSILGAETIEETRRAVSMPFAATVSKLKDPTFPPITAMRKEMRDDFVLARDKFFTYDDSEWRELLSSVYPMIHSLAKLVERFDSLLLAEKNRRGVLEYSDVERYTYKCLWQDGKLTDIAINQANMYSFIYIDEYQDVNGVQDAIFRAVSRENNRFMVGDIKQSIYCFRSADPGIFASLKTSLPRLEGADAEPCAAIFMSDNFRCDKGVVDFVNLLFDKIFGALSDSIGYESGDRLVYSKKQDYGEPPYLKPEVCLADPASIESWGDEGEETDASAAIVARKIRLLLDSERLDSGEPVSPGDIAIILRNARGRDAVYARELERLGVPCSSDGAKSFFLNGEVLLALCLLNSIDNPERDIYLGGLMCSPIFSFDADDLVRIRRECPADTLYSSLCKYTELHSDFERGRTLLDFLYRYRMICEEMATDRLIAELYRDTGLLALASKRGGKENLLLLYDFARRFEKTGAGGLYSFISYINSMTASGKTSFDKKEPARGENAVHIMTAHGSKGLEYPIVFFADADQVFKRRTEEDVRIAYHGDFGIGIFLRSPSGLSLVDNPCKRAIYDYGYKRRVEEEMRVLYVALTRARERLYVVGKPRGGADNYVSGLLESSRRLTAYSVYGMKSFMDVIISATGVPPMGAEEFLGGYFVKDLPKADYIPCESEDVGESSEIRQILAERFSYEYPRTHLTDLPEKMSVSRLYPRLLDDEDEINGGYDTDETAEEKKTLPDFVTGRDSGESAKRGIATHMLLQFCDLKNLKERGAEAELERLVAGGYISKEEKQRVRLREVEMFRNSRLLSDMLGAKEVYRELRFNVRLPASEFTTDRERAEAYSDSTVLVQGVIDCIIEDGNGDLHLIDYKTDRLTAEELSDREKAREKLMASHSLQLSYYAKAVEIMFGRHPVSVEVYSLPLGDTVPV